MAGCSTEETIIFGDPACPAGRCAAGSGATSGGSDCNFDGGTCAVRFEEQIFTPIFDAEGTAKCANVQCHGDPLNIQGELLLVPGDAPASRAALLAYQFDKPAGPYITCATPDDSKLLCNMSVETGATNKYGKCITTMPLVDDLGAKRLTESELELLRGWIACGAPNN
jgi:hypothetical protein